MDKYYFQKKRATSVSPFSPLDYDPLLWLDGSEPDSMIIGSNPFMDQWGDKSGNGNYFLQTDPAKKPSLIENVQNGLSAVFFSNPQMMQCVQNFMSGTSYTAFFVFKNGGVKSGTIYSDYGLDRNKLFLLTTNSGGTGNFLIRDAVGNILDLSKNTSNQTAMITTTVQTDLIRMALGSAAYTSSSGTLNETAFGDGEEATIGAFDGGSNVYYGYIMELLIYLGIFIDKKRFIVNSYLSNKWGL